MMKSSFAPAPRKRLDQASTTFEASSNGPERLAGCQPAEERREIILGQVELQHGNDAGVHEGRNRSGPGFECRLIGGLAQRAEHQGRSDRPHRAFSSRVARAFCPYRVSGMEPSFCRGETRARCRCDISASAAIRSGSRRTVPAGHRAQTGRSTRPCPRQPDTRRASPSSDRSGPEPRRSRPTDPVIDGGSRRRSGSPRCTATHRADVPLAPRPCGPPGSS